MTVFQAHGRDYRRRVRRVESELDFDQAIARRVLDRQVQAFSLRSQSPRRLDFQVDFVESSPLGVSRNGEADSVGVSRYRRKFRYTVNTHVWIVRSEGIDAHAHTFRWSRLGRC